jgi:hypothetical protein
MGAVKGFVWGATIGAGLVYAFDPELGQKRRERVRGQVDQARQKLTELRSLPQRLKETSGDSVASMDTRTLIGIASGVLSLYGFRPRNISNLPLGLLGLALAYKAITNESLLPESESDSPSSEVEKDAREMSREATQEVGS